MIKVGFHVSVSGGLYRAFERALSVGCTVFQIFTNNPRSWKPRNIDSDERELFLKERAKSGLNLYFSHIPYLANFAASGEIYQRSVFMLKEELVRCKLLKVKGVVVHPGKLKGVDYAEGVRRIAAAIDEALSEVDDVLVLLENTAGQGTEVGYRLEHLQDIIELSAYPERIGLCVDTAHAFEAGYPIHTQRGLEDFVIEIEKRFGLEKLHLIHLNDSKTPLGSKVDRHQHIGEGCIGEEGFRVILSHPAVKKTPLIMETPWGEGWDRRNMRKVRELLGSCL